MAGDGYFETFVGGEVDGPVGEQGKERGSEASVQATNAFFS